MTPTEIRETYDFQQLTEKQKKYLEGRFSGKSREDAVSEAYDTSNPREMAAKTDKSPAVLKVLTLWKAKDLPTKEEWIALGAERARTTTDPDIALKYFDGVAKMMGWIVKPSETPPGEKVPNPDDIFE